MYVPSDFQERDPSRLKRLIQENPFATLITWSEPEPWISHVPLLLEGDRIIGHLARFNPHWRFFEAFKTTTIFHGPHCYISSTAYPNGGVPTWNYAVVHARGQAKVIESRDATLEALRSLTRNFEAGGFPVEESMLEGLVNGVVAFEIPAVELTGKFKLSQNRDEDDRQGVIQALSKRDDFMSQEVLRWMKESGG